jgi:hypothetical protein
LNYAPIAVGFVLVISLGWWFCGARKWFTGPRCTLDGDEEDVSPSTQSVTGADKMLASKDVDDETAIGGGADAGAPGLHGRHPAHKD